MAATSAYENNRNGRLDADAACSAADRDQLWRRSWWKRRDKETFSRKQRLLARIIALQKYAATGGDSNNAKIILYFASQAMEDLKRDHYEAAWRSIVEAECLEYSECEDDQLWGIAEALRANAEHTLSTDIGRPVLRLLNRAVEERKDGTEHKSDEYCFCAIRDKGDKVGAGRQSNKNQQNDQISPSQKRIIIESFKLYEKRTIAAFRARERRDASIKVYTFLLILVLLGLILSEAIHYGWEVIKKNQSLTAYQPWFFEFLLRKGEIGTEYLRPIITALIFGMLGSSFSALIATTSQQRIPPEWERDFFYLARPLIGATSGLLALLLITTSSFTAERPAAVAVLAFIFGFSERLVVGTIQRMEGEFQSQSSRRANVDEDVSEK